jgi:hypothetical protein
MTTIITSKEKQHKIVQEMHECPVGGHQGVQRSYVRVKLYVTWPCMFHDVEEYITNCKVCQQNKFTGPYIKAPFQETDTQFHPWDKLYLDIVRPLPMTEEGHKYVLTWQDNLSKYLLAIAMMTQTPEEVALNFMLCTYCIAIWHTMFNSDRSRHTIYGRCIQAVMQAIASA